jgi:hypothetical protein
MQTRPLWRGIALRASAKAEVCTGAAELRFGLSSPEAQRGGAMTAQHLPDLNWRSGLELVGARHVAMEVGEPASRAAGIRVGAGGGSHDNRSRDSAGNGNWSVFWHRSLSLLGCCQMLLLS